MAGEITPEARFLNDLCNLAVAEGFDCIQIVATKQGEAGAVTQVFVWGHGNIFARQGAVEYFLDGLDVSIANEHIKRQQDPPIDNAGPSQD